MFLLVATVLTSAFGLIVKSAQHTRRNPVAVGFINYIFAAVAGGVVLFVDGEWHPDLATVIIGSLTGIFYVTAFWFLVIAIRQGGVAVTMAIVRLAILIPILCSILVWSEIPSTGQTIGIIFVCLALPFLSAGVGGNGATAINGTIWLIVALFVTTGFCHLSPKLLREVVPQGQITVYLFSLFGTSGLVSVFLIRWMRVPFHRRDYGHGILQGLCNLLGTFSIAMTLKYLPATFVFPFTSAAGVVLTTAAGTLVWKEKLGRSAYVGIALSIVALALVNG